MSTKKKKSVNVITGKKVTITFIEEKKFTAKGNA